MFVENYDPTIEGERQISMCREGYPDQSPLQEQYRRAVMVDGELTAVRQFPTVTDRRACLSTIPFSMLIAMPWISLLVCILSS